MKYLLDTNILIYFFKGQGNVAQHMAAHRPADLAISAITLYELEVGIAKSTSPVKRRNQLKQLLEAIAVIPFDEAAARSAAKLRAELEQQGEPIDPLDTQIAGTALAHGMALVSHNQKEFGKVAGLRAVDWYA